ncbi:DUF4865 family protein [Actinacidiphila bryophytorum]|uniref:DUF4865 domain-containing protein n=1 Tax=Actinacidiphila bryophytorum TaxID=1436133 RepID=A0A9W4E4J4_9ACTN|nr:DUF4865 family protein [Actinacidiphila bryophytorum]MBM9439267.1 DUF4865 family protein [Actinacidiphila bryophytorum]MBN6543045.1 DUF4865 family protein [Actinacidiphila bryophytorum]CAG7619707.1 conserved hypothetical protein [Actinacidiphila bryophytorum]
MHAMNYRITLPADYDMEIIRRRVAAKGHLLDDFPGLGLKAYLTRERGVDGSPVNEYAPFYLWNSAAGMNSFLWGPGFRGLVADFGRPAVQHWTGLGFFRGPSFGAAPRAAARRSEPVAPGEDPAVVISRALGDLADGAGRPGLHSAALLVDPRHWELLRFTLWQDAAPEAAGEERFEVLHLSEPGLGDIRTGRHW